MRHERRGDLECTRSLLAATLHGGDAHRLPRGVTRRRDERQAEHAQHGQESEQTERGTGGAGTETASERRDRRGRAGEREPELEDQPGDEDDTAEAGDVEERAADLRDAERGERHAAEGEREAQRLGEGVGGGAADHPPRAVGGDQGGDGVVQRVDRPGDEITRQRELDHPSHPEVHPPGAEEVAEQEPLAAARRGAEGDLEEHHADDGEGPETPRGHRQRDERPGPEGERRTRHAADQAWCVDTVAGLGFDGRRGHGGHTVTAPPSASVADGDQTAVRPGERTTMRWRVDPGG